MAVCSFPIFLLRRSRLCFLPCTSRNWADRIKHPFSYSQQTLVNMDSMFLLGTSYFCSCSVGCRLGISTVHLLFLLHLQRRSLFPRLVLLQHASLEEDTLNSLGSPPWVFFYRTCRYKAAPPIPTSGCTGYTGWNPFPKINWGQTTANDRASGLVQSCDWTAPQMQNLFRPEGGQVSVGQRLGSADTVDATSVT
jgi:hypothetical protein